MRSSALPYVRGPAVLLIALAVAACAGGSAGAAGESDRPADPEPQDHGTPGVVDPEMASEGPVVVQPGAPGEPTRTVDPADLETTSDLEYTEADVRFMQGMLPHHAQALEMVELIADRTDSEELRRMGLRIEISQRDEIQLMERWLRERGRQVPTYEPMLDEEGTARPGASDRELMAGMLTAEQMEELAGARGREFERLFLELMIMHHGGARVMVRNLFDTSGAAQDSEIFRFASDVDADQMAEIQRMRRMLQELRR